MTEEKAKQAPIIGCAFGLNPEGIQKAIQGDASARAHLMGDLRYSHLRAEVLALCGLSPDMSYAEMVAAKGGISPEAFIEASQKQ